MHHKLRRDPSWDPRGCNLCGQVRLCAARQQPAGGGALLLRKLLPLRCSQPGRPQALAGRGSGDASLAAAAATAAAAAC